MRDVVADDKIEYVLIELQYTCEYESDEVHKVSWLEQTGNLEHDH